jgi:hypothetical protein
VHKPHTNQNWYERAAMDLIIAIGIVRDACEASFNSRYVSLCVTVEVGKYYKSESLCEYTYVLSFTRKKIYTSQRESVTSSFLSWSLLNIVPQKKPRETGMMSTFHYQYCPHI